MQIDPNLIISVLTGVFFGGVAWGLSRADVAKLREDNARLKQDMDRISQRQDSAETEHAREIRRLIDSISELGNRLTVIETTIKFIAEQMRQTEKGQGK
jgi:hypothetical protein